MQTSCASPDFTRYGDVLNSVTPVVSGVTNTFKRLFGLPSLTNKVARHFFPGIGHFEFRLRAVHNYLMPSKTNTQKHLARLPLCDWLRGPHGVRHILSTAAVR